VITKPTADEFEQLPYYPYDIRSESSPLDVEEIRTALFLSNGDLVATAGRLKVPLRRLKRAIRKDARVQLLIKRLAEAP
jgi:hypothetical protein